MFGLDQGFATNLLAPYRLTSQLNAVGLVRDNGVVINMSSGGMYNVPLKVSRVNDQQDYQGAIAYAYQRDTAYTDTSAAAAGRSRAGRSGSPSGMLVRAKLLRHVDQLGPKRPEADVVRLTACTNQYVQRSLTLLEAGEHLCAPELPDASFQTIPLHDRMPMLRNDDSQPTTRSGGRRKEDVQSGRPLSLPPPEKRPDLPGPSNPTRAREPKPSDLTAPARTRRGKRVELTIYLEPILTVNRARPRARRRARVFRPPRVFIRRRKPCLLTRFRLRGRYVGFMDRQPLSSRRYQTI